MSGDVNVQSQVAAPTAFFTRTFDEALALTSEARDYLAQYAEDDLKDLSDEVSLRYSVESMRLTSRLTNVMAWLLVQRAAHQGEIGYDELRNDEWRLGGRDTCLGDASVDMETLPPIMADLLRRSENLFRRIARLDDMVAQDHS